MVKRWSGKRGKEIVESDRIWNWRKKEDGWNGKGKGNYGEKGYEKERLGRKWKMDRRNWKNIWGLEGKL